MLDVWVVFRMIGHKVVDIMVVTPPTDTDPTEDITNQDTNQTVRRPISGNTGMSGIMSNKGDLMPPQPEENGRAKTAEC